MYTRSTPDSSHSLLVFPGWIPRERETRLGRVVWAVSLTHLREASLSPGCYSCTRHHHRDTSDPAGMSAVTLVYPGQYTTRARYHLVYYPGPVPPGVLLPAPPGLPLLHHLGYLPCTTWDHLGFPTRAWTTWASQPEPGPPFLKNPTRLGPPFLMNPTRLGPPYYTVPNTRMHLIHTEDGSESGQIPVNSWVILDPRYNSVRKGGLYAALGPVPDNSVQG